MTINLERAHFSESSKSIPAKDLRAENLIAMVYKPLIKFNSTLLEGINIYIMDENGDTSISGKEFFKEDNKFIA